MSASSSSSMPLGSMPSTPAGDAGSTTPAYTTSVTNSGEVHLKVPNGKLYRLSKIRIGEQEIALTGENLKSYAKEVGELAQQLLNVGPPVQHNDKKIILSTASVRATTSDETEAVHFSVGEQGTQQTVREQATVKLFKEVEAKAYHILSSRSGVHMVQKEFSEKLPSRSEQSLKRNGIRILAAITAPITAPVVAVSVLVAKGVDKLRDQGKTRQATLKMRRKEESLKGKGMRSYLKGTKTWIGQEQTSAQAIANQLKQQKAQKNVILRWKVYQYLVPALIRSGIKDGGIDKDAISTCLGRLTAADFENAEMLKIALRECFSGEEHVLEALSDLEIQSMVNESRLWRQTDTDMDAQFEKDAQVWKAFSDLVRNTESRKADPAKYNVEVMKKFREVLATPSYLALKDNAYSPLIMDIGEFAIANWNHASVMKAYTALGDHLQEGIRDDFGLTEGGDRVAFVEAVRLGHEKAESENLTDHGLAKLPYALTHPQQALASAASTATQGGLAQNFTSVFGVKVYDPALVGNTSSLQGTTTSAVIIPDSHLSSIRINNCYGGSPTVGNRVSPEMLAALQAIRNNNLLKRAEPKDARENIPSVLVYTNFQQISNKGGEGERSFAIMQLQARFPQEFVGLTLAKDSDFYNGTGSHTMSEWKGVEDFEAEMRTQLESDACYTFLDRKGKADGEGIYLPFGKEAWKPVLDQVFRCATDVLGDLPDTEIDPAKIQEFRYAYQELVYFLIQAYVEEKAGLDAPAHGEESFVMAIRACKENIDRGGSENAKYLYSLLPAGEPRLNLVSGVLESRALAARDRVVIRSRMVPVLSYMKHVDPQRLQANMPAFFYNTCGGIEVTSHAFEPSFKQESGLGVKASQPGLVAEFEEEREGTAPTDEPNSTEEGSVDSLGMWMEFDALLPVDGDNGFEDDGIPVQSVLALEFEQMSETAAATHSFVNDFRAPLSRAEAAQKDAAGMGLEDSDSENDGPRSEWLGSFESVALDDEDTSFNSSAAASSSSVAGFGIDKKREERQVEEIIVTKTEKGKMRFFSGKGWIFHKKDSYDLSVTEVVNGQEITFGVKGAQKKTKKSDWFPITSNGETYYVDPKVYYQALAGTYVQPIARELNFEASEVQELGRTGQLHIRVSYGARNVEFNIQAKRKQDSFDDICVRLDEREYFINRIEYDEALISANKALIRANIESQKISGEQIRGNNPEELIIQVKDVSRELPIQLQIEAKRERDAQHSMVILNSSGGNDYYVDPEKYRVTLEAEMALQIKESAPHLVEGDGTGTTRFMLKMVSYAEGLPDFTYEVPYSGTIQEWAMANDSGWRGISGYNQAGVKSTYYVASQEIDACGVAYRAGRNAEIRSRPHLIVTGDETQLILKMNTETMEHVKYDAKILEDRLYDNLECVPVNAYREEAGELVFVKTYYVEKRYVDELNARR